jgi:hypothetical protein
MKTSKEYGKQGGEKRAATLTSTRKSEIATNAVKARWANEIVALYQGYLQLGEKKVACAVLKDGRRVIMQNDFMIAMGRAPRGFEGGLTAQEESMTSPEMANTPIDDKNNNQTSMIATQQLPPFLSAANLQPFISDDLQRCLTPIRFKTVDSRQAIGYEAGLLPKVCTVYLDARRAGVLVNTQIRIAAACEMLLLALARVGVYALVDEATGYQQDRARDALQLLLKTYLAEDLLPATRRFTHEYLQGAYRLCGWEYTDGVPIKPHLLGTLINRTIYEKLPPEVLAEIRLMNPVQEGTQRRKYRQHQLLSETTGIAHLDKLLTIAAAMMRAYDNREDFYRAYDKAVPPPPKLPDLP